MHSFQPFPIDMLEFNPFTKFGTDWALVTVGTKAQTNPCTIGWGNVGTLWGKNITSVFLRDSRYTKELLDKHDFFSVTFFDQSHRDALQYCGSHSGRNENKIEQAHLTLNARHNIPFIDEGNLVFLCAKLAHVRLTKEMFTAPDIMHRWYQDKDMHTMYVSEIIEVLAR